MSSLFPLLASTAELDADLMQGLGAMLPELFLCAMVLVVLVLDLVRHKGPSVTFPLLSLAAIGVALLLVLTGDGASAVGYDGFEALQVDGLGRLFKFVFLATAGLTVLFLLRSRAKFALESEMQVLLLGALAGMCYLASATELIGFYVAFELVSYTGYMMAGYRLDSIKGAEAAGKYVIFGSVASAVMLFGITLIFGYTGSTQFGVIAERLLDVQAAGGTEPALIVGCVFTFAGFAFKAAAFPFQFWCPDVYEGSQAPIAGFLAVASKAAAFAVGLRVLAYAATAGTGEAPSMTAIVGHDAPFLEVTLAVAAIGTMTWGNLAALRQDNMQRMLAYSSIAHAGYLLMTSVVVLHSGVTQDALSAIGFYFLIYLCMNLGAFFVVTLVRREAHSADLSALRGAGSRYPVLAICFAIMLFSLTGLPPTAGFVGKLQLFAPVVREGYFLLAAIGLVNGAVSLYYYARPLREMFFAAPDDSTPTLTLARADVAILVALTVPLVVLGLFGWDSVTEIARDAVAMGG